MTDSMETKCISLDPRLSMIADYVPVCRICADIGCNHGRLGAFLLQANRCEKVILSDISASSMVRARQLVSLLGLDERVDFRVGDGARVLRETVDTAVIAGMGGKTIAEIVENASGAFRGTRLILQPNVDAGELRHRLNRSGWKIIDEDLARDGRRIYPVLICREGEQALTKAQEETGAILPEKQPEALKDYIAFYIRVYRKAVRESESGNRPVSDELIQKLEIWQELNQRLSGITGPEQE